MEVVAKDNHKLFLYCWKDVQNPKAVILIIHGMSEHAARYEAFARFLNENGFVVYANDLRGHGKTTSRNGTLGYIGEDGFNRIVEDEYMITQKIKQEYPELPVVLFTHSFGSFVGQEFLTRYSSEINGMILCGSAAQQGLKFKTAAILAAIYRKIYGEKKEAKFLNQLSFGSYNKRILNGGLNDWLSRDPDIVKKYNDDPECGFICTANFYYYFCTALTRLYEPQKLDHITKTIPLFIIAGTEDPVGEYGKSVRKLHEIYKKLDMSNLSIKLYEGARHELLNETNKELVMNDILQWLDQNNFYPCGRKSLDI